MSDALDYAKRLIAEPSVTPATGSVFDAMEQMLAPLGFAVHRFERGDGEDRSQRRGPSLLEFHEGSQDRADQVARTSYVQHHDQALRDVAPGTAEEEAE